MEDNSSRILVPQPRLGEKGMILLITITNMISPLSTDMYMPALPDMAEYFHTTDSIMNMTMAGFYFLFAAGMLVFGPISDKYGRKNTLIFGVLLYVVTGVGCALCTSVWALILIRLIEAIGAGCMIAVTTAIVKDQFRGQLQSTVLSITQVFGSVSPVIAPVIGAQLYRFLGWRALFIALAVIGAGILVMVLMMEETLREEERLEEHVLATLTHLGIVLKNPVFTIFLLSIAFIQVPMMAYVTSSSYIYENFFGLSPQGYSFYFAFTAFLSIGGPVIYMFIRGRNSFAISISIFSTITVSVILIALIGHNSPICFALAFAPLMIVCCMSRPFSITILLNLQARDTGSAASLINFIFTLLGAIGMVLITGLWNDYIFGIVILGIFCIITGFSLTALLRFRFGKDSINIDLK